MKLRLLCLLAAFLVAVPASAQKVEDIVRQKVTWASLDYYRRYSDPSIDFLVKDVERYHIGRDNFWMWYERRNFDLAIGELRYALWVFPNHPKGLHLLSKCARESQRYSVPIPYFEKAINLYPAYAETRALYGAYLVGIGERVSGIAILREALEIDPAHALAKGWLTRAEREMDTATSAR